MQFLCWVSSTNWRRVIPFQTCHMMHRQGTVPLVTTAWHAPTIAEKSNPCNQQQCWLCLNNCKHPDITRAGRETATHTMLLDGQVQTVSLIRAFNKATTWAQSRSTRCKYNSSSWSTAACAACAGTCVRWNGVLRCITGLPCFLNGAAAARSSAFLMRISFSALSLLAFSSRATWSCACRYASCFSC